MLSGFRARRALVGAVALSLAGAALGGCDEMRRPPGQGALPDEISPPGPDPVRGAITATAAAFDRQGQSLAGRPEAATRAVAQFEYLYAAIGREARWAALSPTVRVSLRIARDELLQATGIRPEAPVPRIISALAQSIRAQRVRDRPGAAAAFNTAIFAPGGAGTMARFNRLGPLPALEQATAQLAAEVARLDAQGGWAGSVMMPEGGMGTALSPGLGRGV